MPAMGGEGCDKIQTWTELHRSSWTLEPGVQAVPAVGPELRQRVPRSAEAERAGPGWHSCELLWPGPLRCWVSSAGTFTYSYQSKFCTHTPPPIISTLSTTYILRENYGDFDKFQGTAPSRVGLRTGNLPWVRNWLPFTTQERKFQPPWVRPSRDVRPLLPSKLTVPLTACVPPTPASVVTSTTAHRIMESPVHPFP